MFFIQTSKELTASLNDQSNDTHLAQVKIMMQQFTQEVISRSSDTYNTCVNPQGTVLPFCAPKDKKGKVRHSTC